MTELSPEDLQRYGRHLVMPEVGMAGQARLRGARVLCVGAGGLGSPAALYLAAAGVGTLGIVDDDSVELANLQRQVLYAEADRGRPKTEAAVERLRAGNAGVEFVPHPVRLDPDNAADLVADYDIVVDGSDNFPTRYAVSDACVRTGRPHVYGSVLRFDGQVSLFDARRGPCYRCLFPEPPAPDAVPSCAEAGVLGVLPGIVGSLQALEAIKWVLGLGDPLVGRLLLFDGLALGFREIAVGKSATCPACGPDADLAALARAPLVACGADGNGPGPGEGEAATASVEAIPDTARLRPERLADWLNGDGDAREPAPLLLDVRNPREWDIVRFPGALEIPLPELVRRLDEIPRDRPVVISCHRGARAERAWRRLAAAGYDALWVLEGGIDAWAERIDPAMNRYA